MPSARQKCQGSRTGEGEVPKVIRDCIQGDYCIADYIIQDVGLRDSFKACIEMRWQRIGDESTEASDRERIARFISDLPNGDFIHESKSLFQVEEWMAWKDQAVRIAKCFLAGRGQPDSPLARDLENGSIDEWLHDYIWLEADLYENWWKLVHTKEGSIKVALKKIWGYPFNSSLELFQEMVRADLEGEFANCLKSRYCYKAKEIKKIAILKRKAHRGKLSKPEREEMYALIDKHGPYPIWYDRVISVSEWLAKRDPFIQERLRTNGEIIDAIAKRQIKRNCDPRLKHHKDISHTWENGIRGKGIKPGWKL